MERASAGPVAASEAGAARWEGSCASPSPFHELYGDQRREDTLARMRRTLSERTVATDAAASEAARSPKVSMGRPAYCHSRVAGVEQ